MVPTLLDFQVHRGIGTNVIREPWVLNNEIGNASMMSSQLHAKYLASIHRLQFLAKEENLPDGGLRYAHRDLFDLSLTQEVLCFRELSLKHKV